MAEVVRFVLDTLSSGAGPGNHGADLAIFRPEYDGIHPRRAGRGDYRMSTIDWIKRGRPVEIIIPVPEEVEDDEHD